MFFYFAIPLGGGLAYAISGVVANETGHWQWGMRISPVFGLICIIMFLFTIEPKHGQADGFPHGEPGHWLDDVRSLYRCKSLLLSTIGWTAVNFCIGVAAWWGPTYIQYSQTSFVGQTFNKSLSSMIFGICTGLGGLVGTLLGSSLSVKLRQTYPSADPIISGITLVLGGPVLFGAVVVIEYSLAAFWFLIFLSVALMSVNWAITPDILLYVTTPRRRATATGMQMLIGHLFGDAMGPYIVGAINDAQYNPATPVNYLHFLAMQRSTFMLIFVLVLGAVGYLAASWYVVNDWRAMKREVAREKRRHSTNQSYPRILPDQTVADEIATGIAGF